jgi:hypothetical protein
MTSSLLNVGSPRFSSCAGQTRAIQTAFDYEAVLGQVVAFDLAWAAVAAAEACGCWKVMTFLRLDE